MSKLKQKFRLLDRNPKGPIVLVWRALNSNEHDTTRLPTATNSMDAQKLSVTMAMAMAGFAIYHDLRSAS